MKITWRHFSPADPATKVPALEQVVPQLILLTLDQRQPLSIGGALNFRCKPFDVCAALKLSDTCAFIQGSPEHLRDREEISLFKSFSIPLKRSFVPKCFFPHL